MSVKTLYSLILFLTFSLNASAQDDATEAYYRGSGGLSIRDTEPIPVAAPAPVDPSPAARPREIPASTGLTTVRVPPERPVAPAVPVTRGQGGNFLDTLKSDRDSLFFKKFAVVFKKCTLETPGFENCNATRSRVWGERGGKSCHPSRQAIDVSGLKCNGVEYDAYTLKFKNFTECIAKQKTNGKTWCRIFREAGGNCSKPRGQRPETECHYDHAHFGLGCAATGC